MVTMLAGGRGQVVIKGKDVTREWEQLVRKASERNGQQFPDAVVEVMRDWALGILKRETDGEPARADQKLPAYLHEVSQEGIDERFARLTELVERQAAAAAVAQAEQLSRIERASRRSRWQRR